MVHPNRFLLNFGEIEKYKDGNTFYVFVEWKTLVQWV